MSPSEFLTNPMVQDEEEIPAHTEVCKENPDEVLRHWTGNSDEKQFDQCFPTAITSIASKKENSKRAYAHSSSPPMKLYWIFVIVVYMYYYVV